MMSLFQVITAAALIVLILLQERSAGLSGLLAGGGDSGRGFYQARRGLERIAFRATIVIAIVFAALSIAQLLV